ncbi:MAG: glycohydrolase toxin TNT-related protein [Schaalia hyovaginalis]|nr:glycohydrolase toxin TNT-related protein [Schaalia hyovaginalis]
MGVGCSGAPLFVIEGDPAQVRSRAAVMQARSREFAEFADAVASISTDGWSGRAADRFRARFECEPQRWREAASGFARAGAALSAWADAVSLARVRASSCKALYEQGEEATRRARIAYEAQATCELDAQNSWLRSGVAQVELARLSPTPFTDPGQALRDEASAAFAAIVEELDQKATWVASEVRAGCAGAPSARNWVTSGLEFIGGVLKGAGEAVVDLGSLIASLQFGAMFDGARVLSGDLSADEFAAKYAHKYSDAAEIVGGAYRDPAAFAVSVGKGVLDWDTWADDPARALGHLVPDAAATIATAGAGTAALAAAKLSRAGRVARAADRIHDGADLAADARRGARGLAPNALERTDAAEAMMDAKRSSSRVDSVPGSSRSTGSPHPSAALEERLGPIPTGGDPAAKASAADALAPMARADEVSAHNRDTFPGTDPIGGHDTPDGAVHHAHAESGKADHGAVGVERRDLSEAELTELRSRPPESIQDIVDAVDPLKHENDPTIDYSHGRIDGVTPGDLVKDPRHFFGTHPDGSPKSFFDWVRDFADPESYRARWPQDEPGKVFDGMVDDGTVQHHISIEDYRSQFGSTIDRIGNPGGSYFGAIDDGRIASFEERAIAPSSIHESYYQYEIADGPLPEGITVTTGTVAPWHGAPGGARQLQFFENGEPLNADQLVRRGILRGVVTPIGLH